MSRIAAAVLLLAFAGGVSAQDVAAVEPSAPLRYELANGLKVVLAPDPSSTRVALIVSYRAGSSSDPQGLAGLAHFAEHMAYRGSLHVSDEQFFSLPQDWGATSLNGITTPDQTSYQMLVPPAQLARALWLESERMAFVLAAQTAEHVELERKIVRNEYLLRGAEQRVAYLVAEISLPPGHPTRSASRAPDELAAIDLPAVQWFYQRVYRPDNASLMLAGAFDPEAAKALIERYFEPIRNPAMPRIETRTQRVEFQGSARARLRAAGNSSALLASWTLPPGSYAQRRAALNGLALLLKKRLREELVHGERIAPTVEVGFEAVSGERVTVRVTTPESNELSVVERVLEHQLEQLRRTPIAADELIALRRELAWRLLLRTETTLDRALTLLLDRAYGSDEPIDLTALAASIRSLSAEQLTSAARELLPADRKLVVEIVASRGASGAEIISFEGELFPTAGKSR